MQITLFKKLTNKYRLGWDYLDAHQFLGYAKMLTPRLVTDEGIDGRMSITRVIAPAALGSTDLSTHIATSLSYSHCRHEYDCCGCATVGADVRRLSRRQYSVRLFTSYNI
jgi:hypothetical protein